MTALLDLAIQPRGDGTAQHDIEQCRFAEALLDFANAWQDVFAVYAGNQPSGLDAAHRRRRSGIHGTDHGLAVDDPHLDPRVAVARTGRIHFFVNVGREDAEMRLFQPLQHVGHDLTGLFHGAGLLDFREQFVVRGLPVHAAHLGVPVLVANSLPDILERVDVQLAFAGSERIPVGGECRQN